MVDKNPYIPRADSFEAGFCDDPNCGLHIVAFDKFNDVITEIVMSPKQTLSLVTECNRKLYEKATQRDG